MGERGYLSMLASLLADALYALGRFDNAARMIEEAQAGAAPDDTQLRIRWQSTKARLLAQGGQFAAARQLLDEIAEVTSPSAMVEKAGALMARAEVEWLAGRPGGPRPACGRRWRSTRTGMSRSSRSWPERLWRAWPPSPALGRHSLATWRAIVARIVPRPDEGASWISCLHLRQICRNRTAIHRLQKNLVAAALD